MKRLKTWLVPLLGFALLLILFWGILFIGIKIL